MRNSIKSRDRIFVKSYGVLSFLKSMSKNTDKYVGENIRDKYNQILLDCTN